MRINYVPSIDEARMERAAQMIAAHGIDGLLFALVEKEMGRTGALNAILATERRRTGRRNAEISLGG